MVAGGIRLGWCVTATNSCPRPSVPSRLQPHLLRLVRRAVGAYALAHADAILDRNPPYRAREFGYAFWNGWNRSRTCPSFRPRPARRRSSTTTTTSPSYDFCTDMVKFNGAFVTPGDCFEEPKSFRVGYGYSDDTAN